MTLAETQALFHQALVAPAPLDPARLEACFAGTPDLPAADRVAIYAGMYLWRLVDALRETFPALARHLGDEAFAGLAEDYLRRHPSEHHDVGQVGRRLPAFLREFPDPERPDLADLAALEWARQQAFFAPSAEPVGPEALASLDPAALDHTRLVLAPSLEVLVLEHAVAPLWRRLDDGEAAGPPAPGPEALAVWRAGFDVVHGPLDLDEAAALRGALAGASLAATCAAFVDREDPAAAVHQALSGWLAEGWITGVAAAPARRGGEG